MIPKTPFNSWIIGKVASFLSAKEGCVVDPPEYTKDGCKVVVQDAFGYRYELNIKTISRITNDSDGLDKYAKAAHFSFLSTTELKK